MALSEKKAQVYKVMGDVIAKFILAMSGAAAFIMITVALVNNPRWELSVADSFFAGTLFFVFRHYFPAATEPKK